MPLGPGPHALLAWLLAAGGEVVSRPDLLAGLPGAEDTHTVEVTINHLRAALGRPQPVRTVVRRGCRLAIPDETGAANQRYIYPIQSCVPPMRSIWRLR